MTFTNKFEQILRSHGLDIILRKRVEGPNDQRGHPTVTYDEIGIRAFLQQNTGSEQLILGQHVKNYDAFMLTSKQVQIKEGDEIQWHDKIFRVAEIIENRSHIECHLKKVEA